MPEERHDEGEAPGESKPALPQQSSRFLWFVSTLAVVALVLGGIQFSRSIKEPFIPQRTSIATTGPEDAELVALKAKDTDSDTLTDYDELYIYSTSPYIADSDSDNVDDKAEIDRGTDPNCPEGKTCGLITNSNTNSVATNQAVSNTNTVSSLSGPTAQQIRDALIASGVSKTEVDAIDDATLLQSYQEAQTENSNTNSTTNSASTNTNTSQQLTDLSAAEIRKLLQANGVSADVLNSYDDATLRAVYLQAVQESLSSSTNTNAS